MNNSSTSSLSPESAQLIKRIQSYFKVGFENIQPYCYGNDKHSIDLKDLLLACKANFPFGFDVNNDKYVKSIIWDFSKLDSSKPVSSLAIHLVFGVFIQSRSIQLNVGRKKIKNRNEWTFKKSYSHCSLKSFYDLSTFNDDLLSLNDETLNRIIDEAQTLIDTLCVVVYTDTPEPIDPKSIPQHYRFSMKVMELAFNDVDGLKTTCSQLSLKQRNLIIKYNDLMFKSPRLPLVTELDFFKTLIDSLESCDKVFVAYILSKVVKNSLVESNIAEKFGYFDEFAVLFETMDRGATKHTTPSLV